MYIVIIAFLDTHEVIPRSLTASETYLVNSRVLGVWFLGKVIVSIQLNAYLGVEDH